MDILPGMTITREALRSFSGSPTIHCNPAYEGVDYTDGVKFISDNGGAWLVVEMLVALLNNRRVMASKNTLIITLTVYKSHFAELVFDDGTILLQKNIPWTDFPLDSISFNYANKILCLPSEN